MTDELLFAEIAPGDAIRWLVAVGVRFTLDTADGRVRFVWAGEGPLADARLPVEAVGERPRIYRAVDLLATLRGITPLDFVGHVLGTATCEPRHGDTGSHGSGLPWALCSVPEWVLPCAVLCGRQAFADWERTYQGADATGRRSGYADAHDRLVQFFGSDPIDRLRAVCTAQAPVEPVAVTA